MAISKEALPKSNNIENNERVSHSPRPSGIAGISSSPRSGGGNKPISSRPSGVAGREDDYTKNNSDDIGSLPDEMGYGRIVKVVCAVEK